MNDDLSIAATIEALNQIVSEAAAQAAEAHHCLRRGERLAGMGAISGVDRLLTDALALHRAAVVLHMGRRP